MTSDMRSGMTITCQTMFSSPPVAVVTYGTRTCGLKSCCWCLAFITLDITGHARNERLIVRGDDFIL